MDLHLQLEETRKSVENTPLCNDDKVIQLHLSFLDQLVLLAEEHLHEHYNEWQNAGLVKAYLQYAIPLATYPTCHASLAQSSLRLNEAFNEHPRLKVELLKFEVQLANSKVTTDPKTAELTKDLNRTIKELERNINFADKGQLDKIPNNDFFQTDPIEWTEKWENNIDEVYHLVEQKLGEPGIVMGISLEYWKIKAEVLKTFGIEWKSPAEMNPDIIFD